YDVPGGAPEHGLRLAPDREHGVIGLVNRDDRGLVEHDALSADVYERVGRPEVDGEIIREHSGQKVIEHHRSIVRRLNPRLGDLTVAQSVPPRNENSIFTRL